MANGATDNIQQLDQIDSNLNAVGVANSNIINIDQLDSNLDAAEYTDNDVDNIDQLDSVLNATEYTDSKIENLDQVDSDMTTVITLNLTSGQYLATIKEADWSLESGKYYYTIPYPVHNLIHPFVVGILVLNGENYDNPVYSYSRLPNKSIRLVSDIAIDCEVKLSGDK
jgi:hypothetical protein